MKFICNQRGVTSLYTERLDLSKIGELSAERVSDVHHKQDGWYAAIALPPGAKLPVGTGIYARGGVPVAVLGPFSNYSSAVAEERLWIDQHLLLDYARSMHGDSTSVFSEVLSQPS